MPQTKNLYILSVHQLMDMQFVPPLATMNNTTVNNHEQVSVWIHWLLSKDMGGPRARPENLWNYK